MATVNTVNGPVDADDLGVTYMHEHIFMVEPEMQHYWPGYAGWDEDLYVSKAKAALQKLHDDHGVTTVVDPTVPGLGRNVRAVARASEGVDLNVVVATGWYVRKDLPHLFSLPFNDPDAKIKALETLFMRDVEEGLEGTAIKPGVIKCTTAADGLTADVDALLRASARTHLRSGLPIITHSDHSNRSGLVQQAIFREEGVDLGAVVIGHTNQSDDVNYLLELIDGGSLIGFDQCGFASPNAPLDKQLENLAELCRRGYSDRIVLSNDRMIFQDLMPREILGMMWPDADLDSPYGQVHVSVLPGLRELGVGEDQINNMLVEAPRSYFS